jgi:endonuclease/exonuclease/phosphatase family metal-dependent hydrolase
MKLLQLNVWMGKLLRQAQELIEAEQPDILCLQEVYSSGLTNVLSPDPMFSSLEVLARTTGFEHSFMSPTFTIKLQNTPLNYGNAIISRWPLLDQKTVFVSGIYTDQPNVTDKVINIRNLQLTRIELDGQSLVIANHHGYWQPTPIGDETTVQCIEIVADELIKQTTPLIMAGDLNITADSPAMEPLRANYEDLTASHNIEDTLSSLGKVNGVPCDHILISPEIKVNAFSVSNQLVSDHKALLLDFDI